MIYLVEHFFSIQGEGRYCGVPSIFLRFGGCNLRCPGFGETWQKGKRVLGCDTVRAVYTQLFKEEWQTIGSADAIDAIVASYTKDLPYRPDVVITGGEPMLYADDPVFAEALEGMVKAGLRVTVETNATIAPDFDRFPVYQELVYAMAVKLSNSGEPLTKRVVPSAIAALAKRGRDSFFKFTLDRAVIERDAKAQIDAITSGCGNEIFCMPLGESIQKLHANAQSVVAFCLRHGYRYSDRLHVRLWNREEKR